MVKLRRKGHVCINPTRNQQHLITLIRGTTALCYYIGNKPDVCHTDEVIATEAEVVDIC